MNKVTIDVEARFVDNLTDEAKDASKEIEDIGKAAEKTEKKVNKLGKKKVKPIFDADDNKLLKKLRAAESKAQKLGKTKTTIVLKAMDKATTTIGKVLNWGQRLHGKTFSAIAKVKDSSALKSLREVLSAGKSIAGKTWTAVVKIKDMAMTPLTKLKNTLFSIKTLIGTIAAGYAASKVVGAPISLADQYSKAKIGFSTLLGEAEGQQMMDDLDAFAKKSPFDTSGVISNAQKMLAMGWDASSIVEDMEIIGNAAASTGNLNQGLESIVRAMSQIKTKGKLSAEELNQLAEAGIAAKPMLAEMLGYGTGDEALAKFSADQEKGLIGADKALEALLQGMKKYDGMMDSMANETAEGLMSQIKDTFEVSVVRKWGQGLQDGAKQGLGTVAKLLDTASGSLEAFGDTLYQLGSKLSNWAAGKLGDIVDRITDITGTMEFKEASLGKKFSMLWKGVITDPLSEWWENGGREKTASTAGKIGSWMGEMLTKGLLAIFGATDVLDDSVGTDAGSSVAGSFLRGFLDNFDGSAITQAFVDAIGNIWGALPAWAKTLLGLTGAYKAGGVIKNVASMLGSASGTTGLLGIGTNAAINMGAGNLAGGASLGAGALSALGLASSAGLLAGGFTAVNGGFELYDGIKNNDSTAKKSGGWKLGGSLGGAGLGAAIGSVIPGVGTLVGAGVGALAGSVLGWWQSSKVKKTASEAAAEVQKLREENEKLAKTSLDKHFGDVTLSAEEMRKKLRDLIGEQTIQQVEAATAAIDTMNQSFSTVQSQSADLKKSVWMAYMRKDTKLADDEITSLKGSVESYGKAAKEYLSDAQYASEESIKSIMGNSEEAEKLLKSTEKYYKGQGNELNTLTKQLEEKMSKFLSDGVLSLDEKKSLDTLREQIANITRKLQDEKYEANLNILKAKYAGDLTPDGFNDLMKGAAKQNEELAESYWQEFGQASIGKSAEEIETLRKGVNDKLSNMWANTGDMGLGTFREQYSKELGILSKDIGKMLEENTPQEIIKAVNNIDDETRQGISKMMEYMKPTTEEIESLVKSYEDAGQKPPEALTKYLQSAEFYEALGKGKDAIEDYFKEWKIDIDPQFQMDQALELPTEVEKIFNTMEVTGNLNVAWEYDEFDDEWISPDKQYSFTTDALVDAGWTYNPFNKKWISPDGKYWFNTDADVSVDYWNNKFKGTKATFGIQGSYDFNTQANINVAFNVRKSGGLSKYGNPTSSWASKQAELYLKEQGVPGFATGGLVQGGGRLVRVAEEGTPEMIIPLGSQRRERGLKLWAKAGEMLEVPGFARGGRTDNGDEGLRFHEYGSGETSGGDKTVHVDVGGVTLEIHVNGTDAQSIAAAIKAQVADIAEDVAGVLADAFAAQFANTPVRGGVA